MSKKKYRLIVTAHPDDETLFMGGLILSERKYPWTVICVTNGNADGQGAKRYRQLSRACKALGVSSFAMWDFEDKWEKRLPVEQLISKLKLLEQPFEVFTHGIIGEYGHPHHQDVSWAVHQAFRERCSVWSVAYNCFPDKIIKVNHKDYIKKATILSKIYFSETQRFSHLIPNTFAEGFCKLGAQEVDAIYAYVCQKKKPKTKNIVKYKMYWTHFKRRFSGLPPRIF